MKSDNYYAEIEIQSNKDVQNSLDALLKSYLKNDSNTSSTEIPIIPVGVSLEKEQIDDSVESHFALKGIEASAFEQKYQTGGMARIYLGFPTEQNTETDHKSGEHFIKALVFGYSDSLLEEAKIHSEISNKTDAVPKFYSLDEISMDNGTLLPIISMESVNGEDLESYARNNNTSRKEKLMIMKSAVDLVGKIHDAGYVHRDVKPENFMVSDGKVDKIIDLGIASKIGEAPKIVGCGTPKYLSPEHLTHIVDSRMDIYALGCMLNELMTGETPYSKIIESVTDKDSGNISSDRHQELATNLYNAMCTEEHATSETAKKMYDDLSEDISEVITTSLRGDPDKRYQSCAELSDALSSVIAKMEFVDIAKDALSHININRPEGYNSTQRKLPYSIDCSSSENKSYQNTIRFGMAAQ